MSSGSGRRFLLERSSLLRMNLEDFKSFIKQLGFRQTWQSSDNRFHLETDIVGPINSNYVAFHGHLSVDLQDNNGDFLVYITHSNVNGSFISGENLLRFNLSDFNELNKVIFINKILPKFNKIPPIILEYLRDNRIKNILDE